MLLKMESVLPEKSDHFTAQDTPSMKSPEFPRTDGFLGLLPDLISIAKVCCFPLDEYNKEKKKNVQFLLINISSALEFIIIITSY